METESNRLNNKLEAYIWFPQALNQNLGSFISLTVIRLYFGFS